MLSIDGKVAFVTGIGSVGPGWGNGRPTATLFARQGAAVFGVDIDEQAAEKTCSIIEREGGRCLTERWDMTNSAEVGSQARYITGHRTRRRWRLFGGHTVNETRRFGPLPRGDMTAEQEAIADAILRGPRGERGGLRGPFEAFLRSPGVAEPAQRLGEHVRFRSILAPVLNELAILLTARRWTAQFEWYVHRRLAEAAGLDPATADAIAAGTRPLLDDDGAAVCDFVTELLDRGDVTDSAWEGMTERWGKAGAMDLIGLVGYYTLVSFTLNVDRYPVPDDEKPLHYL